MTPPPASLKTLSPASRSGVETHDEDADPESRLFLIAVLGGTAGLFTGLAMFAAIGLATTF